MNKIIAYFETNAGSTKVAEFETEELYITCLPALEKLAKEKNQWVTESLIEEE